MIPSSLVSWFQEISPWVLVAVALALNIGITGASAGIWRLTVKNWGSRTLNRRDLSLTTATTLVNSLMILPGWWLWHEGYLELASLSPLRWILETLYLVIVIDVAMYLAHRICHLGVLYHWFHSWHHSDDAQTSVSLFVMHPFEAAAFGVAVIGAMLVWPVSVLSVGLFFTGNLIVGTYAHLPASVIGPRVSRVLPLVWIQQFHQGHHVDPTVNFGFFSVLWDRLGGTSADQT